MHGWESYSWDYHSVCPFGILELLFGLYVHSDIKRGAVYCKHCWLGARHSPCRCGMNQFSVVSERLGSVPEWTVPMLGWRRVLGRSEIDLNVPFFIWLPSCSLNIYEKFIFSPTSKKKDVYDTWWCSWVPSHEVNPRRIRCFKSPKASCLWATSVSLSQFPKVAEPHPVHLGLGESVCSLITMNFPLFLSSCTNLCQAGSEHPKETFLY